MQRRAKRRLVVGAGAALAVAGGGAGIAAVQAGSPAEESQAVIDDAAKQLGVQPSALSNALRKALEDRVDAAVAAGRLTKAEGDALKQRIASGELPLIFGGLHGPGMPFGHSDKLSTAATYLGVTEVQLRADLESGKTLAQVAKDRGKSVDGLIQAMTKAEQQELDAAVAAGRLTKDQEQSMLSDLKQRITDFVNGTAPRSFRGFQFRGLRFRGDQSFFDRGATPGDDGPTL